MCIKSCSKFDNFEPGYYKAKVIGYEFIRKEELCNGNVLIKSNITVEIEGRLLKEQSVSLTLENRDLVFRYKELLNKDIVVELDYDCEDGVRLKIEHIYDVLDGEKFIKEQEEYRAYESVGLDDYTISLFF